MKKIIFAGLAATLLAAVAFVAVSAYGQSQPHKVAAVGCNTQQFAIPVFAKGLLYEGNGLPAVFHYKKSGYTRTYRAAHTGTGTMTPAPGLNKAYGHKVYIDTSSTCTSIYVAVDHGPFKYAVYKKSG